MTKIPLSITLALLFALTGCATMTSPEAIAEQERASCRAIDANQGFPRAVDFMACLQTAEIKYMSAKRVPSEYVNDWLQKTTAIAKKLDNKQIAPAKAATDWEKAYSEMRRKTEQYFAQQAEMQQAYLNSPEYKIKQCQQQAQYSSINPSVKDLRSKACQYIASDTAAYLELERQATALEMQESRNDTARHQTGQNPSVTTNCIPTTSGGMWCNSY